MKKAVCVMMTILFVSSLFGCAQKKSHIKKDDFQFDEIKMVAVGSGISFVVEADGSLWA